MPRGRSTKRSKVDSKRRYVSRSRSLTRQRTPVYVTPGHFTRSSPSSNYAKLVRSWAVGDVTVPANGNSVAGVTLFSLARLDSYAEIQNLYYQYRVDRIILEFIPYGTGTGFLTAAIDNTEGTAPTSGAELRQSGTCTITPAQQSRTFSYKPNVLLDANGGTGDAPKNVFLRTNESACDWTGVKWILTNATTSANAVNVFKIHAKVYMSCRNLK